jgi:hypothetical protein
VDTDDALVASGESVSAAATPMLEKTAAPTPRATASPPTRPMYVDALIISPDAAWVTLTFAVSNLSIVKVRLADRFMLRKHIRGYLRRGVAKVVQ